jgi:transcription initiation factor TFIIE subunit beta
MMNLTTKQLQLRALDSMKQQPKSTTKPVPSSNTAPVPSSSRKPPSLKAQVKTEGGSNKPVMSIQHMSTPRSRPNQRVFYDVIKYLNEVERPVTIDEIHAATAHDIKGNPELLEELKANAKIHYEDGWFSYKPMYDAKNIHDLLDLFNKNPNGIDIADLKDAYKTVEQDIKKLLEQRDIVAIRNEDTKSDILYPNLDPRYRITISDEFKKLWREIRIPDDIDLEREMKEAGLTLVEEEQNQVRKPASKAKKPRKARLRKITNTHILGTDIDITKDYVPGQ